MCACAHVVYRSIVALNGGARGPKLIQTPFKAMSTPVFGTRSCVLCGEHMDLNYSYFEHLCDFHLNISIGSVVRCAGSPSELFDVARDKIIKKEKRCRDGMQKS